MRKYSFKKQISVVFSLILNIWKEISYKRKIQFIFLCALSIINSLAEILSLSIIIPFLGLLINKNTYYNSPPIKFLALKLSINNSEIMMNYMLIIFIVIILASTIIKLLNVYYNCKFSALLGVDISSKAFYKIVGQRYKFHQHVNSSSLISSLTSKVDLAVIVIGDILQLITSGFVAFGIIITLIIVEPKFTLLTGGIILFFYFLISYKFSLKKLNVNSKIIDGTLDNQIKLLQEAFGSIIEIILNSNQNEFLKLHHKNEYRLRDSKAKSFFLARFPRYFIEGFIIIFIGIYGYILVRNNVSGAYVFTLLGGLAISVQKVLPNLQLIYLSYATILSYFDSVKDLMELNNLDLPEESSYQNNKKSNLIIKEKIEFKNISFKYENKKINDLSNLNFEINKGEKIGIVGETGSGKSTLLKIIMGLIFPEKGSIILDKRNIFEYKFPEHFLAWRASIAYVPQSIYLKDASIAENIAISHLNQEINYELVKECAKIANIDKFINTQSNNYNHFVGERGTKLSGGQLQRIGIARALYKRNTNIIILDEATSALDSATEEKIIQSINNNFKNKVIVIVSHKLNTLKFCDRIFKISNGKLEEFNNKNDNTKKFEQ